MKLYRLTKMIAACTLISTGSAAIAQAAVQCRDAALLAKIRDWQNTNLIKQSVTVKTIDFGGQSGRVCYLDFSYSDGTVDPMLPIEILPNGQFKLRADLAGEGD